jgi:hypothetical protein
MTYSFAGVSDHRILSGTSAVCRPRVERPASSPRPAAARDYSGRPRESILRPFLDKETAVIDVVIWSDIV